jgi:hypothetical protein
MSGDGVAGRDVGLRRLALVSGVYDGLLAVPMLFFPVVVARAFGAPDPVPVLNAQLNGAFTLVLAVGYFWAAREVGDRLGFLWCAGVLAKGLGAALFVVDHFQRGSPMSFLLFAGSDGSLALLTLVMLVRRRSGTQ